MTAIAIDAWSPRVVAVRGVVAGIDHRITVHGMRYTFTHLVRRANVDAVVGLR